MKKWMRAACVGAAAAAMLTASAFAADYTNCADALHDMGLFQGTEQGYDLDREPTRAEAAAMLVRLLGKEAEAKELTYTAPFTDLKDWQKPYVQYLYENGLVNGTSAASFSPQRACTAQMYAAFLLRALGYDDPADFTYAEAVAAAKELGIYDTGVIKMTDYHAAFLRDDVAAASYTALSVSPKGEDGTLLDKLTAEQSIDAAAAKPYQKLFADYEAYRTAAAGMDTLLHFSVNSAYQSPVMVSRDDKTVMQVQTNETTVFDREAGKLRTDRKITLSAPGVEDKSMLAVTELEDSVLYHTLNGNQGTGTVCTQTEQEGLAAMYGRVPLAWISELKKGTGGSWSITCAAAPKAYREMLWPMQTALGDLDEAVLLTPVTVEQSISGGLIRKQSVSAEFTLDGLHAAPVFVSTLDKTGA